MQLLNANINISQQPVCHASRLPAPTITNRYSSFYINELNTPTFSQVAQAINNINVKELMNETSVTPIGQFVDWMFGWGKKDIANLTCELRDNKSLNNAIVPSNTEKNQNENLDDKSTKFPNEDPFSSQNLKTSELCYPYRRSVAPRRIHLPEPSIVYLNDGINHLNGSHPIVYRDECCVKRVIVQNFTMRLGFFQEPAQDSVYYPEFLENYAQCTAKKIMKYFHALQKEENEENVCFLAIEQRAQRYNIHGGTLSIESPDGFLLKQFRTTFTLNDDVKECFDQCFDNYKTQQAQDRELEAKTLKKIAKFIKAYLISYIAASILHVCIVRGLNYMQR